jgi:hypothetical protein
VYTLNPVDPQLESAWFQPSNISSDFLVSTFAFKFNLYRYTEATKNTSSVTSPTSKKRINDTMPDDENSLAGTETTSVSSCGDISAEAAADIEARVKLAADVAAAEAAANASSDASKEREELEHRVASLDEEVKSLRAAAGDAAAGGASCAAQIVSAREATPIGAEAVSIDDAGKDDTNVAALHRHLLAFTVDLAVKRKEHAAIAAKVTAAESAAREAEEAANLATSRAKAAEARAISAVGLYTLNSVDP